MIPLGVDYDETDGEEECDSEDSDSDEEDLEDDSSCSTTDTDTSDESSQSSEDSEEARDMLCEEKEQTTVQAPPTETMEENAMFTCQLSDTAKQNGLVQHG